jgi:hypothetical protein
MTVLLLFLWNGTTDKCRIHCDGTKGTPSIVIGGYTVLLVVTVTTDARFARLERPNLAITTDYAIKSHSIVTLFFFNPRAYSTQRMVVAARLCKASQRQFGQHGTVACQQWTQIVMTVVTGFDPAQLIITLVSHGQFDCRWQ